MEGCVRGVNVPRPCSTLAQQRSILALLKRIPRHFGVLQHRVLCCPQIVAGLQNPGDVGSSILAHPL